MYTFIESTDNLLGYWIYEIEGDVNSKLFIPYEFDDDPQDTMEIVSEEVNSYDAYCNTNLSSLSDEQSLTLSSGSEGKSEKENASISQKQNINDVPIYGGSWLQSPGNQCSPFRRNYRENIKYQVSNSSPQPVGKEKKEFKDKKRNGGKRDERRNVKDRGSRKNEEDDIDIVITRVIEDDAKFGRHKLTPPKKTNKDKSKQKIRANKSGNKRHNGRTKTRKEKKPGPSVSEEKKTTGIAMYNKIAPLMSKDSEFKKTIAALDVLEDKVNRGELTKDEALNTMFKTAEKSDGLSCYTKELKIVNSPNVVKIDEEGRKTFKPEKPGKSKSNIMRDAFPDSPMKVVDYFLIQPAFTESLTLWRGREEQVNNSQLNRDGWDEMGKLIYKRFGKDITSPQIRSITNPTVFYEETLKQYISQDMINTISHMESNGIFEKYKPAETPLLLGTIQAHMIDVFPKVGVILPLHSAIEKKLAPTNSMTFNPYGTEFIACVFFWSFSFHFNLFGAFFKGNNGGYNYYWVNYNRIEDDVSRILLPQKPNREKTDISTLFSDPEHEIEISGISMNNTTVEVVPIKDDIVIKDKLEVNTVRTSNMNDNPNKFDMVSAKLLGGREQINIKNERDLSETKKQSLMEKATPVISQHP